MEVTVYKIEAVIRPQRLEAVQESLYEIDLFGLTVTEARGMGRQRGVTHTFRGSQYALNLAPKIKIEVVVKAEMLDEAVTAITDAAYTGEIGDGKIFIIPVSEVVRIRTGERGTIALS